MEAANEVIAVSRESVEHLLAHSGHDSHVEYNIDRVSKLYTCLCDRRTDRSHGVRDNVHCSALHNAVIHRSEHCVHFFGIHPVVGRTSVFLPAGADECSVLNTGNVVGLCSVVDTARELLLVELYHLTSSECFLTELVKLLLAAVDPYNVVGLAESLHLLKPLEDILIVCHHSDFSLPFINILREYHYRFCRRLTRTKYQILLYYIFVDRSRVF